MSILNTGKKVEAEKPAKKEKVAAPSGVRTGGVKTTGIK